MRSFDSKENTVSRWPANAEQILERMSCLQGFPANPRALERYVEILKNCDDEAQALRTVDSFEENFPSLADFRAARNTAKLRPHPLVATDQEIEAWYLRSPFGDQLREALSNPAPDPKTIEQRKQEWGEWWRSQEEKFAIAKAEAPGINRDEMRREMKSWKKAEGIKEPKGRPDKAGSS
jgi:hypothetical protein